MAITNTSIQIKKSGTSSAAPSSLNFGELALNYSDGKLYFKNSGSVITYFPSASFGTTTNGTSSIIATTPNDTLTVNAGSSIVNSGPNIIVTSNPTTKTLTISTTANVSLTTANITGQLTTGNNSTFGNTSGNNYLQISAAAAAISAAVSSPRIIAAGSDGNIAITLVPKGTYGVIVGAGSVSQPAISLGSSNRGIYNPSTGTPAPDGDVGFVAGGYEQMRVYGTAAAVNYAFITGNVTGFPVTFGSQGSDTNIGINLTPKGTGIIYANSNNTSTSTSTGALVVLGGIGVVGNVYSGGTVTGNHAGSGALLTSIPLTSAVSGILQIANGGTNSTATPTAGGIAYGTGTAFAWSAAGGAAGQILVSGGAGAPIWAANSITINGTSVSLGGSLTVTSGSSTYANISNTQTITTATTGIFYPVMVNAVTGNLGANAATLLTYNVGQSTLNVNTINVSSQLIQSVSTYAAAGTTQGTATALPSTATYVNVTTGTGGLVLPAISNPGVTAAIFNNTAAAINIYPPSGATIDNALANIPVVISAGSQALYIVMSSTSYQTLRPVIVGGTNITTTPGNGNVSIAVTGTIPIVNGGTNSTATPTAGGIVYGNGTAHLISTAGTSGQVLVSGGAGAPIWAANGVTVGSTSIALGAAATTVNGLTLGTSCALGTPASGTVTNLTGTASININGTVGATTPTTGAFTSLTTTVSGYSNTVTATSGQAISYAPMNGGRSYYAYDLSGQPSLYEARFVNLAGSTNVPSGLAGSGYWFGMGAGDVSTRGFSLMGSDSSGLWYKAHNGGSWTNVLYSGGALGTPASGTLTNCTFPTLNQNTTGSANSATYVTGSATVPNSALVNKTIVVNGTTLTLGDTGDTITAAAGTLTGATLASGVTGSSLTSLGQIGTLSATTQLIGSGAYQVSGSSSASVIRYVGDGTQYGITLVPTVDNTVAINFTNAANTSVGTIAATSTGITFNGTATLAGSANSATYVTGSATVPNSALTNSSVTIGSTAVSLGSTVTSFAGVTLTSPTFTTPTLGTPASGTVTNLTGTASININGTVGATTPTTGVFTTAQITSLGVGTAASGTTGEIRATNNITAFFSDKRLKKNIKPISGAISKVMAISGVTYEINEVAEKYGYTDKKEMVGVIAQELERVLPQVVVPAPFDAAYTEDGTEYSKSGENYKTVQYEKIVPLLIEAIKEQQREIEELKQKVRLVYFPK